MCNDLEPDICKFGSESLQEIKYGDFVMLDIKNSVLYKKILFVVSMGLVISMMLTACSGKKDENGSMKAEDGRSYGGTIKAEVGTKVNTAFFEVTVEEAAKYETYQFEDGLYQADDGKTYLVVKLTLKNTYEKDLPMSITDFTLDYEGNKADKIITGYGKADLKTIDFMENIFTLKKGESITKSILFTVADKESYTLNYTEFYEDEFEGNKFQITLEPKKRTAETALDEEDSDGETPEAEQENAKTEEDDLVTTEESES